MRNIYLIRHGQTDSNNASRYCGWTDVELNHEGEAQAKKLLAKLKDIKIDIIYSSPLKRADKTAHIINEHFNVPIIHDDRLKERNFGVFEDLTHEEITIKYNDVYMNLDKDWEGFVIPEGESTKIARDRVLNFADTIMNDEVNNDILIVSHGGCIRSIIAYLLNMHAQDEWRFKIDNATLSQLTINDRRFAYLTLLNR